MLINKRCLAHIALLMCAASAPLGALLTHPTQALADACVLPTKSFEECVYTSTNSGQPPMFTRSFYMNNPDPGLASDVGCSVGNQMAQSWLEQGHLGDVPSDSTIILDFGTIVHDKGVYVVGSQTPANLTVVIQSADSFIDGYWRCALLSELATMGPGPLTNLPLGETFFGIGTNNSGSDWQDAYWMSYDASLWSGMLPDISNNRTLPLEDTFIHVEAANDVEIGYSGPAGPVAFSDSFVGDNAWYSIIDYGDAAGCPDFPETTGNPCNTQGQPIPWNLQDVVHIAWWDRGIPLPEIYTQGPPPTNSAACNSSLTGNRLNGCQWQVLRYWSSQNSALAPPGGKASAMQIAGPLSQSVACQQKAAEIGHLSADCKLLMNTPDEAWKQLDQALQVGGPSTQQATLPWSSGIEFLAPGPAANATIPNVVP